MYMYIQMPITNRHNSRLKVRSGTLILCLDVLNKSKVQTAQPADVPVLAE